MNAACRVTTLNQDLTVVVWVLGGNVGLKPFFYILDPLHALGIEEEAVEVFLHVNRLPQYTFFNQGEGFD